MPLVTIKNVLCIIMILSIAIVCFSLKRTRSLEVVGWETDEEAKRPFKPGLILNSQPPPKYEVKILEPEILSNRYYGKSQKCRFLIAVNILENTSSNSVVSPADVSVKIFKTSNRKRSVGTYKVYPFLKKNNAFIYSGFVTLPADSGEYNVFAEVIYTAWHVAENDQEYFNKNSVVATAEASERFNVYKQTSAGEVIHVKK